MFNYLIGNSDAHAKNVSILIDENGFALAPFYDLLCVQVYGDDKLALYVGDDDHFDSIGAHSWEAFCEDCGFGFKPTLTLLRKMAQDVLKNWAKVVEQTSGTFILTESELALMTNITRVIKKNCTAAASMAS